MSELSLQFPRRGLSDDSAFSEQAPLTTRLARNVRAIDPITGRTRGAQRAGLSAFISSALSAGNKVQAIGHVALDRPKVEWTELTETDNGSTDPGSLTAEWSVLTPGEHTSEPTASSAEVVSVETDSVGNVYALEFGGTIQKYNSSGVFLKAIPLPVTDENAVLRKIVIDEEDRIYAVAAAAAGEVGGKVWQFRLLDAEEEIYALRWTLELEGTPQSFDVRLGVLAIALDFEEGESFSGVRTYQQLYASTPQLSWEKACPNPVRGIHIDKAGNVFTTHPSNALRGEAPGSEGFVESANADSYTPLDIGLGSSELDARFRLHSLLMADQLTGLGDAEVVNLFSDHRFIWTQERSPAGNQPPGATGNPAEYPDVDDDKPNRCLRTFPDNSRRPGPRFRLTGAGPNPTVHFNGEHQNDRDGAPMEKPGLYLRSFSNVYNTFKSDTGADGVPDDGGSNQFQRSIIPGHTTGHETAEGWGNAWVISQVWRIPPKDNKIEILWTQNGNPVKYALLANATIVNGNVVPQADTLVFLCNRMSGATVVNWAGDTWQGAIASVAPTAGTETATGYVNPAHMVLVTIGHAGWDWDGLDNPRGPQVTPDWFTGQSFLRVNGRAKRAFTFTQMASYGDSSFCVVGNPHWREGPSASDLFDGSQPFEVHAFTGELCQHVCILGHTTTTANDTMCTRPGETAPFGTDGAIPTNNAASGTVLNLAPDQTQTQTATVVEKLEGLLAHRWWFPHVLPNGITGAGANGLFKDHPFGGATNPPIGYGAGIVAMDSDTLAIASTRPILAKWGANGGSLRWALNGSGFGNGVVTDSDRGVFSVGEKDSTDTGSATDVGSADGIARKTIDLGGSASVDDADGAWIITDTAAAPGFAYPVLRVDGNDDFYWALGASRQLRKYDSTETAAGDDQEGVRLWIYKVPASGYKLRSVALDPNVPVYDDTDIKGPAFIYVGSTGSSAEASSTGVEVATLERVRVVAETQVIGSSASPRSLTYYGVAAGDFYTFPKGGSGSIPTGGSGAFESESPYIQLVSYFGRVFGVDGFNVKVYSPLDDEVTDLEPEDAGEIPRNPKLIAGWNGRLVLARTSDSDRNWHMSRRGNPEKWNYTPVVQTVDDAVAGTSSRGPVENPDTITALIPASDDRLYVGGDHTIHVFQGDPLFGGSLDLVSDQTGMSFGSPWAKDREGNIYFFGQLGSVWMLGAGGGARRISERSVERRFQDLDLSAYRIGMVWAWQEEGLYVFQLPYGAGGVAVPAYFWDQKNDAWFEVEFGATGVQPTAVATFDGDEPSDRVVAFGCEDGVVRFIDRDAETDDGNRIDSRVLLGPFAAGEPVEVMFSRLQIALALGQGGCRYRWFVSDSADADVETLAPVEEGVLQPGQNPINYARARGRYVWLELRNADVTRWAFESGSLAVSRGGRARVRP